MNPAIEIITVGSHNNLFQVGNGEKFGIVEFAGEGGEERVALLRDAGVQRFLCAWLREHGAFNGSQVPPRLEWHVLESRIGVAA